MSEFTEPPFDTAEAARRLAVPVSWIKEHRAEIPHRRMGGKVRYTQADLDTYLARVAVDPDPLGRSSRARRAS